MRPLLLRRLVHHHHQKQQRQRSHGQLVLSCIALAAAGAAAGGDGSIHADQQQQHQEDEEEEELDTAMQAEGVVAHGRRLNVRVSPWLSALPGGPDGRTQQQQRQQNGRRRPRPGSEASEQEGEKAVWRQRPRSKYVIVGMGAAGSAALRALLACEPDAEVTVVEAGLAPEVGVLPGGQKRGLFNKARGGRVTYLWGTSLTALDADGRELLLSDGSRLGFDKCLLAVGSGRPRVPSRFVDPVTVDRVLPLAGGAEERQTLARLVAQGRHVTIVGSNWPSIELASYLSAVAKRHGWGSGGVTLIFPESTPLARELPRYLSGLLLRRLERRGVEVLPHTALKYVGRAMDYELRALNRLSSNDGVGGTESLEQPVRVYLTSKFASLDGSALLTDRVVIGGESGGGGRRPPVRFAGKYGLEGDGRTGSLVVSHEMMASSSVFVAGDAAHFPNAALGQRLTVKSADHAFHSGWVAGMNMAGRGVRYEQLPLFFGCVPRLGIRAAWVGVCEGSGETHGFWWRNNNGSGSNNGNGGGPGTSRRVGRRRVTGRAGEELDVVAAADDGVEGAGGGLGGKVKDALASLFGDGGKKKALGDNTSSVAASMNIGVGVGARDSKAGRQLGLRKSATVDRVLLDTDAEGLLAAAAEEEREGNGIGVAPTATAVSFTPVNGTGVVFFMDGAGGLRGVLVWGLVPVSSSSSDGGVGDSDDGDDLTAAVAATPTTTREGLSAIDPVLCGVIERARLAVAEGRVVFKYDMNSRAETLAALKGLALDVLGPTALEQLGPRQPMYTYTSAKTIAPTSADEALFRLSNTSKAASEVIEEAYEAAVKGKMAPIPGTNSMPFPFNRN